MSEEYNANRLFGKAIKQNHYTLEHYVEKARNDSLEDLKKICKIDEGFKMPKIDDEKEWNW